jgi:hypothetical protein
MNRRGRRARRGNHRQRLKTHEARKETDPFPKLPGCQSPEKGFHEIIPALSIYSSMIFLSLSMENTEKERIFFPEKENSHTP